MREEKQAAQFLPLDKVARFLISLVVFAGGISVVIELGFYPPAWGIPCLNGMEIAAVLLMIGHTIYEILVAPSRSDAVRRRIGRLAAVFAFVVLPICAAAGVRAAFLPDADDTLKLAAVYSAFLRMLPAPGDALALPLPRRVLAFVYGNPARAVILSFALVILLGTGLLSLPRAAEEGEKTTLVDAFFTATSATCVTGLVCLDTPEHFSRFGHWVILGLIQMGGLGIMTTAAFFVTAAGRRLVMSQTQLVQDSLAAESFGEVQRSIKGIIAFTFAAEAVGATLLFPQWCNDGAGAESPLFCSVFHSVSAFCNAGFSLFSNNLLDYSTDVSINLTITSLIIAGGLGFPVMLNLAEALQRRGRGRRLRLTLHSRLALLTTLVLIVVGAAMFFFIEKARVLRELPLRDRVLVSYFQSVTTRTAGFNTVEIGALSPATQFGFMILMFIGGSPGGTAGGIKTTTAALLILALIMTARGKERITWGGYTIPIPVVLRALAISVVALLWLSLLIMLLLLPVSVAPGADHTTLRDIMFEAFSAFGTVGLSTGLTPNLSSFGKVLICTLMFVGRVGPLSLAIMFSRHRAPDLIRYPEANVLVG